MNFCSAACPSCRFCTSIFGFQTPRDGTTSRSVQSVFFDSLVLVPSVVKFKVMWSPWHDAVALVRALGRTRDSCDPSAPFALLPALQTLEFYSMRVDPAHFVDLVTKRWLERNRTLTSVKFCGCYYPGRYFKTFLKPGQDPAKLAQ